MEEKQTSKIAIACATEESPIIPGLPDDLAVQCLLRIPRKSHKLVRGVSRRWFEFIESQPYYTLRRQNGVAEGWIYILARESNERLSWRCLDPKAKQWHPVSKMPHEILRSYGMACEACNGMLYAIGGVGWSKPPKQEVFRYNPIIDKWTRVAPMEHARCYAVSGVLNDQILVAGGMGTSASGLLTSVEVYDSLEDKWCSAGELLNDGDLQDAVVWNNKLHVSHIRCVHTVPGPHVQTYNPIAQKWEYLDDEMAAGWHGSSVEVDGKLYMVEHVGGIRLMVFDKAARAWRPVGRLSPALLSAPCKLVGLQGKLYVVGRGCTAVEVDLKAAERLEGLLVTRRIEGVGCSSDVILSCHVLYL